MGRRPLPLIGTPGHAVTYVWGREVEADLARNETNSDTEKPRKAVLGIILNLLREEGVGYDPSGFPVTTEHAHQDHWKLPFMRFIGSKTHHQSLTFQGYKLFFFSGISIRETS